MSLEHLEVIFREETTNCCVTGSLWIWTIRCLPVHVSLLEHVDFGLGDEAALMHSTS
jgi:hypothetical protein